MLVMNALFIVTAIGFFWLGWKIRGLWDRWRKKA